MTASPRTAPEFFVDTWSVYKKIVGNNYMFHREIYGDVQKLLPSTETTPFSLLDLGCGDASQMAPILRGRPLKRYCGVDLSDVALQLARQNLDGITATVDLVCDDMLGYLEETEGLSDVIFSSFALHHLTTPDKQRFLNASHRRLSPGGRLILIDVMRDETQPLADYLDHYCGTMEREWTGLSAEELRFATTHVRDCDLPDTLDQLETLSRKAGFNACQPVCRHTWHQLVTFLA